MKELKAHIKKYEECLTDKEIDFIIDSLKFVLSNNNFTFDGEFYHQNDGTAMGTKLAPPYACLCVAYLEETKLFPTILPTIFNRIQCQWIEENLKRYMDDGFIALLKSINFGKFLECLNAMHPSIKFTDEKADVYVSNGVKIQQLNFLDISVLLTEKDGVQTDIFYKATNSHDYLNYHSSHPEHTKRNIPYNLAKRIVCFVSNDVTEKKRLTELRHFLKNCNYPEEVIEQGIHNAKLQGPAPEPTTRKILPLVTTNFCNLKLDNVLRRTKHYFSRTAPDELKETFDECNFILSHKQPKNLLKLLAPTPFPKSRPTSKPDCPVSKCSDKRCKICQMYLQFVSSFTTSSGYVWHIKSTLSCHSKNVIYYLTCNRCDGKVTYIGKTVNLRLRTNGHISSCRLGKSTDIFDNHVFNCDGGKPLVEPFFKLYLFMSTPENTLLTYESHLQSLGHDTLNR